MPKPLETNEVAAGSGNGSESGMPTAVELAAQAEVNASPEGSGSNPITVGECAAVLRVLVLLDSPAGIERLPTSAR